VKLYLKLLTKQGKFKEALDFIDMRAQFFESNKHEKQTLMAKLFFLSNQEVLTINVFFNMLRLNSNVHQYHEMQTEYTKCIRIIMNDFLPNPKNQFHFEPAPEFLSTDTGSSPNFDPISVDDKADKIVRILYLSLRSLRKTVQSVDLSQRKLQENATDMRRQSYLGELEVLYCYALRCRSYPVGDGTTFMQLMLEYVDLFFDKSDVVRDIKEYVKLLSYPNDT